VSAIAADRQELGLAWVLFRFFADSLHMKLDTALVALMQLALLTLYPVWLIGCVHKFGRHGVMSVAVGVIGATSAKE
jgi:hypothetical protein